MLQGSYGAGLGRYIGGLVPDVTVRADGSISPIRSYSWVGGLEWNAMDAVALSGYYSGVVADDEPHSTPTERTSASAIPGRPTRPTAGSGR
jgi:hypothetical protein